MVQNFLNMQLFTSPELATCPIAVTQSELMHGVCGLITLDRRERALQLMADDARLQDQPMQVLNTRRPRNMV
jgi:hypothetical protein